MKCKDCKELEKRVEAYEESLLRIAKFISFEAYLARKALRAQDVRDDILEKWEEHFERLMNE